MTPGVGAPQVGNRTPDDPFGKWWPCLKKHQKRVSLWLPRALELKNRLNGSRSLRYFTLCARPMIDVYMLVKESILPFDPDTHRIDGVSFCELDENVFPELKELVGTEEAGFHARLEDLLLFQDISETAPLDTEDALTGYLESVGEGLAEDVREKVAEKRRYLSFRSLFPFDFMNLDFCDRFYEHPPNVMRIHGAVERLLEWQRRPGTSDTGVEFSVSRFVVAITCRVGADTPPDALMRLKRIIESNRSDFPAYDAALRARAVDDLDEWASTSPLDFFMSAWPKEIAKMAREKQWDILIRDHAFYERVGDSGQPYNMVCLVLEFSQTRICQTYLTAATACLDARGRTEIGFIDEASAQGQDLLRNLRSIVTLRNHQAEAFGRAPLPDPLAELRRLRADGVAI